MAEPEPFREVDGVFVPPRPPRHRDEEYDEQGFNLLMRMQREHFWYRGRHHLLLNVLRHEARRRWGRAAGLSAIDMGGGCGGWLQYLQAREPALFSQLALGDSSRQALALAAPVVGGFAARYQMDLLDLAWSDAWDVVFLLDVLEHIPDQRAALRQIRHSLRPGGLLFVTTPALQTFWTYNDELVHHQRRYAAQDFQALAAETGLKLVRTNYFMFFLSPALLASRLLDRPAAAATAEQRQAHLARTHHIPAPPLNAALAAVFSLEARLVNRVHFPWGTSILAVLQR